MPKLMYGFIFRNEVKELVESGATDFEDIVESLNDIYGEEDIIFGGLDEDSDMNYCYAAVEITSDIFEDAEGNMFSMDLDQIKDENERQLLDFIDGNAVLSEYAYSNAPRIFFVE
jgi:hypothetical protein